MPLSLITIVQATLAFIFLLLTSRLMAQKFSVVAGTAIGAIAGLFAMSERFDIWRTVIIFATWGVLSILNSFISIKSNVWRNFLNGKPTVLIEQGKILEKNLRKARLTGNEMMAMLRAKNMFKLADVELGVMEADGQLSVMKKSELQPITPVNVGIPVEADHTPHVLILDGKVIQQTMDDRGYSYGWLLGEIMKQGAANYSDVFLAQVDSKGNVYVDLYTDALKPASTKPRAILLASLKKIQADLVSFALETDNREAKVMYQTQAQKLESLIGKLHPFLRE